MATLSVVLTKPGGETTYNLLASKVEHSMIRTPAQSGLVGDTTTQDPIVLMFDLGMCVEQITITGLVNSAAGGAGEPTKAQLETVVREWWAADVTAANMTKVKIYDAGGGVDQEYYGAIKSCGFQQEAALTDRWAFSLVLLVADVA